MQPEFTGWRRYTLVEPPLMLFLFSYSLTTTVVTDLMLFRSCQTILGANSDECDVLHTNSSSEEAKDLEELIQPHASYILMCKSFVDGLVPAFLSFFMGPWSDKYGRKPLMIAGHTGAAISFLLWTFLSTLEINPWIYLAASIPPAIAGGFCGVILATMCYITDVGKSSDRTWHFACVNAAIALGLVLGSLAGRYIFEQFGYAATFATACTCSSLALLYVIFMVPETIVRSDVRRSWCSLFDVQLVKDMFVTCTKKRDGFDRTIVWCCIICLSLSLLIIEGDGGIQYMFSALKLGWGVDEIMTFSAIAVFTSVVGLLLGAQLAKKVIDKTMTDMSIAVIACVSSFAGSMMKAFTTKPSHFYLSSVLAMFGSLMPSVVRSALSRSAPPEDIGKIFSLTTSMEAVIPLAAPPLYTLIYTHNLPPVYPSPVYLVSASFYLTIMILVVIIDKQIRKSPQSRYVHIIEEID